MVKVPHHHCTWHRAATAGTASTNCPQVLVPVYQMSPTQQGFGRGAQGHSKPVGFVKESEKEGGSLASRIQKTDEELEEERKEQRRRDEENSFRDVSVLIVTPHGKCSLCCSVTVDTNLGKGSELMPSSGPLIASVRFAKPKKGTKSK